MDTYYHPFNLSRSEVSFVRGLVAALSKKGVEEFSLGLKNLDKCVMSLESYVTSTDLKNDLGALFVETPIERGFPRFYAALACVTQYPNIGLVVYGGLPRNDKLELTEYSPFAGEVLKNATEELGCSEEFFDDAVKAFITSLQ